MTPSHDMLLVSATYLTPIGNQQCNVSKCSRALEDNEVGSFPLSHGQSSGTPKACRLCKAGVLKYQLAGRAFSGPRKIVPVLVACSLDEKKSV